MQGGDPLFGLIVSRWTETGTGTSSGVTVTHGADANLTHLPVAVYVSGDLAATVTIESPASTALLTLNFGSAFALPVPILLGCIQGAPGKLLQVKISASTSLCAATICGVSVYTGKLVELASDAAALSVA